MLQVLLPGWMEEGVVTKGLRHRGNAAGGGEDDDRTATGTPLFSPQAAPYEGPQLRLTKKVDRHG